MIESSYYTQEFYEGQQDGSYVSAKKVLPLIKEVVNPQSVIDIGCGVGYWLKVWKEDLGISDIFGIEGPYVSKDLLKVPAENVRFQDLKEPLRLDRKFDLAMSLEVAEHLPASDAEAFVKALTKASDVVLFSAAIFGQGGTYHKNEQMPEYWAAIFAKFDYVPVDYVRRKIWSDEDIEWWYRQNILIYIRKERLAEFTGLQEAYRWTEPSFLLRVHPELIYYKEEILSKTTSWRKYAGWRFYLFKKKFLKKRKP